MTKRQNAGPGQPEAAGMSTPPMRITSGTILTTEGNIEIGQGVFQTQVLPTGMHILRCQEDSGEVHTYVLGGHVFGHTLVPSSIEVPELVTA